MPKKSTYDRNRQKYRAKSKAYREANADLVRGKDKARNLLRVNKRKEQRRANRDTIRVSERAWKRANRERVNACNNRRRAKKNGCTEHHTAAEWLALKARTYNTCLCCGREEPEIALTRDHIVPLELGGNDDIGNIQPLCKSCNSAKGIRVMDFRLLGV